MIGLDPANQDALTFFNAAEQALNNTEGDLANPPPKSSSRPATSATETTPTSFANGRYEVKCFLGEGSKKRVYLAQDTLLDREVAFALINTEGQDEVSRTRITREAQDEVSRTRITREAQAMGRLGSHPHIVTVFDLGEHEGQPYMVWDRYDC